MNPPTIETREKREGAHNTVTYSMSSLGITQQNAGASPAQTLHIRTNDGDPGRIVSVLDTNGPWNTGSSIMPIDRRLPQSTGREPNNPMCEWAPCPTRGIRKSRQGKREEGPSGRHLLLTLRGHPLTIGLYYVDNYTFAIAKLRPSSLMPLEVQKCELGWILFAARISAFSVLPAPPSQLERLGRLVLMREASTGIRPLGSLEVISAFSVRPAHTSDSARAPDSPHTQIFQTLRNGRTELKSLAQVAAIFVEERVTGPIRTEIVLGCGAQHRPSGHY
ncbi:hypothetical protein PSPO01_09051 [Paraphaeosphaeria sporulosa]